MTYRDKFSDYSIFLQADAGDHLHLEYLRLVLQMLATTELDIPFLHLNMHRVVKSVTPCKNATYVQIFGREPHNLQSYCCAQFLVRRDRILARDKAFYEKMLNMMDEDTPEDACKDIPGHSTHCLMYESMWHVVMGEPDTLPFHYEHTAVPFLLRVSDTGSASNLPIGAFATHVLAM